MRKDKEFKGQIEIEEFECEYHNNKFMELEILLRRLDIDLYSDDGKIKTIVDLLGSISEVWGVLSQEEQDDLNSKFTEAQNSL